MSRHAHTTAYAPALGDTVEVREDATPRRGEVTALLHAGRIEVSCADSTRQVCACWCRLVQRATTCPAYAGEGI